MTPDPRPPPRVRDPHLLKRLHWGWRGECAIADTRCVEWFSLHHIHRHPRDDVQPNLAMLCGDGVAGHHGAIEAHHLQACRDFARYLLTERLDTIEYLGQKLGRPEAVKEWLNDQLHAGL